MKVTYVKRNSKVLRKYKTIQALNYIFVSSLQNKL